MKTNIKQQQTFLSKSDLKKVKVVTAPVKSTSVMLTVPVAPVKISGRKPTMSSTARALILEHGATMDRKALGEKLWETLSTDWKLPLEKKWYCAWYISDMGRKGKIPGYVSRVVKQAVVEVTPEPVKVEVIAATIEKANKKAKAKKAKAKK